MDMAFDTPVLELGLGLLAGARAVAPEFSVPVAGSDEFVEALAVMGRGGRHGVVGDQVGLGVAAHVVFVAVVGLFVFLGPACVGVFLREFVRLVFPFGWSLALLDLGVFLPAVALPGYFHEACVDDDAFLGQQAFGGEVGVEVLEQRLDRAGLGQRFAKAPHGRVVGNRFADAQPEKTGEAHPVGDLI